MNDRDRLYFHFSNLGLVLIGLFSIQSVLNPYLFIFLLFGSAAGFAVSWQISLSRPQHMDTFIGMLSLASVIIIIGKFYDIDISFENILSLLSLSLVWLMLFQSFGLRTGKSYAMLQFISVCLLISSAGMALEQETFYVILLALFLFIFLFAMRLSLVCEKKRKGSVIIGDQANIMSLWQQVKVTAIMFSLILIVGSFVYPLVPRLENISLRWIPSTLLGIPEEVPIFKILTQAPKALHDNDLAKKEQLIDDMSKKRETDGERVNEDEHKEAAYQRFRAKEFDQDIDTFEVQSLEIKSDKTQVQADNHCKLEAELKLKDGTIISATNLVDWKGTGTAKIAIGDNGILSPESTGSVVISAVYLGNFSNDVTIEIVPPAVPINKAVWWYWLLILLSWLFILVLMGIAIWVFIRSRKLKDMAIRDPRKFIKEVYVVLCRGFKFYGVPKFSSTAYREFFKYIRDVVSSNPGSMNSLTENFLEASFSKHKISFAHSQTFLKLFHEVKDAVMEKETPRSFWKKTVFTMFMLDALMIGRDIREG